MSPHSRPPQPAVWQRTNKTEAAGSCRRLHCSHEYSVENNITLFEQGDISPQGLPCFSPPEPPSLRGHPKYRGGTFYFGGRETIRNLTKNSFTTAAAKDLERHSTFATLQSPSEILRFRQELTAKVREPRPNFCRKQQRAPLQRPTPTAEQSRARVVS